jgi:ABC-type Fe3+ transport system permease subunit
MENGAIAILLVVAIGVLFWRLSRRGPSRMSRALYTIGTVVLLLWLLSIAITVLTTPGAP